MQGSIFGDRLQAIVFAGLSLGALVVVGILRFTNCQHFQRFLGSIDPLIAFPAIIVLGFVLLGFLHARGWFVVYARGNSRGLLLAAGLAALLGVIMILVDTKIVYPEDTNVPFPASLAFYPSMAFLAEILLHVLPISALLAVLTMILRNVRFDHLVWIAIPIVSLLESVYQVLPMVRAGRYPIWGMVYVGIHLFAIGFLQLLIFRKYDFLSMYCFRLVYYVFWHVGWGHIRLGLLF